MNILVFLAAAAGAFYLIFQKTVPKATDDLVTEGGKQEEIAPGEESPVEKVEIAGRKHGTAPEKTADFTGGVYDPLKNPFRKAEEQMVPPSGVPSKPPPDFPGSYDDLIPGDEPVEDAEDEEGIGDDGEVDSEDVSGENGNGQL